ncbi:MAG: Carbohydrate binding family 6 [Mucilaginibacter sp.]|nr:Carbohydrate binding family 6 [Mucilaginibacter sp.]
MFNDKKLKRHYNWLFLLKNNILIIGMCALLSNCHKKNDSPQPVNPKPIANFSYSIISNGTLPCTVKFTDSSKYADTYKWDFGDGNSSTIQSPSNIYNSAKTYNVKLVVSNSFGKDSITKQIIITLNKPKANFDFTILDNGNLPTTVNFKNSTIGGSTYQWYFDDGNKSALSDPVEKYTVSKSYNVKLVATNAVGKDSIIKAVAVTINKPKADFNFTIVNDGTLPCNVSFTNASSNGQTYKWNFGDGNTSVLESPKNIFNIGGTFPIKLVVSNQSGKDSVTKQVTISNVTVNPIPYSVRIFLITPTDRAFNQKYYDAIKMCALNLQSWYKQQMGGKTFTLNNPMIEILQGKHNYAWYNQYNDTYSGTDPRFYGFYNTLYEIQQVIGTLNTTLYMNAIYVAAPGGGAGSTGLCALGDQDLDGLLGINPTDPNVNRWIGGSGHEWGHGFGLAHPANQDPNALMWTGYGIYPNCVLLQEDKDILNVSLFFK